MRAPAGAPLMRLGAGLLVALFTQPFEPVVGEKNWTRWRTFVRKHSAVDEFMKTSNPTMKKEPA